MPLTNKNSSWRLLLSNEKAITRHYSQDLIKHDEPEKVLPAMRLIASLHELRSIYLVRNISANQ